MTAWLIIATCLGLAVLALYGVRRLDNPPTIAVTCAALGSAGAVGMIALPIAHAGGAGDGGIIGAGLVLAAAAAPLCWLWLTGPRAWTRPAHGRPTVAAETPAAAPTPPRPSVAQYRVRSAAEAIAEAQGLGPQRSARVRRIVEMEA